MNKSKINYTNDEVTSYYAYNPGGVGCSQGCSYCWTRSMANRSKCPKCKNFEVHIHPEWLSIPARARIPRCVVVGFTGDTFDKKRPPEDIDAILNSCVVAPWHVYIFLTKQPERAFEACQRVPGYKTGHPENWFIGTTVTDQRSLNNFMKNVDVAQNIDWLSIEPMHGPIQLPPTRFKLGGVRGIIIGHENRSSGPGTDNIGMVEKLVKDAKDLGLKVYVKQLWLDGKLVRDPAKMPEHLRLTELAWTMPPERITV